MMDRIESSALSTTGDVVSDPAWAGLHYLIEQTAAARPEAVALRFVEEVLDYATLNRRANQCAHYLRELGVGPDVVVGVCMERSIELVVALLGILKAGGAYLPLATDSPAERLEFTLADAGMSLVLTRSETAAKLERLPVNVLSLDAEGELLAGLPAENPTALTGPGNLAYTIYTSGSTGKPKGCMIEHASICNRLLWMRDQYGILPSDRILQKTPYTFDVSVWEFFLPFISGAGLILAKPGGHKDNLYLRDLIQAEGITACHFVPSMLRFFLRQSGVEGCTSLRHVFASGEALPYALMSDFLKTLPAKLHNLYGPTEAAVDVSYWACAERADGKAPIGRPIANVTLLVLDENLRPVPAGQPGELFIGGIGVGRGYLNRPDLTRERFVTSPASPGLRLYRTGDQVRLLPDGELEYLGRLDFQVKVRGFRIELGEIEETLRSHERIEDAAVLVRDAESDDPKLVAYLVFRGPPLALKEVREFVKRKLPEYMAPNQIAALPALPVSDNGKLNRTALPWPLPVANAPAPPSANERSGSQRETAATPEVPTPRPADHARGPAVAHAAERVFSQLADAEIDADMRGLFQRALGSTTLADTDDLFDLGATSFTMVQAVDYIQKTYGVTVPIDVFFDTPTIRALAAYIRQHASPTSPDASSGQGAHSAGANARDGDEPAPISLERARFRETAFTRGTPTRQFTGQPVPVAALGRLLSLLRCHPDRQGPKHLYSSAGGLRSLQCYLYARENGVQGLAAGYYYYHPGEHRLYALGTAPRVEPSAFAPFDRPALAQAGFVLFLIAQRNAIQPIYGNASPVLTLVEAGYIAQVLVEHQELFGLGVCPVTGVDFEPLRSGCQLEPAHRFLHCLIGGMPAGAGSGAAAGGLADYLRAHPAGLHAHCSSYRGEATFSHYLQAENLGDGLPTPEQKEDLHRQQLHLRPLGPEARGLALEAWEADRGYYLLRAAKRAYREGPMDAARLGRFLSLLDGKERTGSAEHIYASPAGLASLKVFVYLKPGGVGDLAEGLYRFDPELHRLELVTRTLSFDLKSCYTPFNRQHYQRAKFCLFLVGPIAELRPVFGEDSTYVALLESGYIGQLLLDRQAEFEIGVCPIGGMRYEKIRQDFQLEAEDVFLHSFVGGEVEPECPIPWEPLEEGRAPAGSQTQPSPADAADGVPQAREAIAIVGVAGRYPEAENLEVLARNLREGKRAFREHRFDPAGGYRAEPNVPENSHWGGFLAEVDCFDSRLFKITPAEARTIDPQERLLLEVAWETLENAGYTAAGLNRVAPQVGVFVGAMWDDYQHFQPETWPPTGPGEAISAHHSSLANRISFYFDFTGPSLAVNTSCSSAMTALHLGCQSVLSGECQAALVGGVNLMTHPYHQWVLSAAELLSADHVCRPFGREANGWVAGEGVGAVLLKRLSDAIRDGDTIHGVIRGTTIRHSGRTSRYGAPHSQRQAESMRAALEQAGVAADSVNYVEAAAPGAGMADASEAAALKQVFGDRNVKTSPVRVGSVKGNIGHLESASAMSQLAKVLLQLKHREVFPTVPFPPLNPLIQWEGAGLDIPNTAVEWPPAGSDGSGRRRALINAFGASGSGGHALVEEYPIPTLPAVEAESLAPLSAATAAQLQQLVRRLCDHLETPEATDTRFPDLAYTLRVGREHLKVRLAVIARSHSEFKERLKAYLAGAGNEAGCFTGEVDGTGRAENLEVSTPGLAEVARKWVVGVGTLGGIPTHADPRRVPLPTYPFAKERHWVHVHSEGGTAVPARETASANSGARVEDYLKGVFSRVTEIPRDRLEAGARFEAYGMTSLMVRRITDLLAKDFGELSAALLFEHQTLRELAEYLRTHRASRLADLVGTSTPPCQAIACSKPVTRAATQTSVAPAGMAQPHGGDLAIVGVSGRYPKAPDIATFWENLTQGLDAIGEIPSERWDDARVQTEVAKHSRWGGFLDGVDEFDPLFFKISPREAAEMDPQERLFLETVWHLFEDAGWAPSSLSQETRRRMGVFVGVMYGEYQLHSRWEEEPGEESLVTSLYGSIANRISYVFDFHGPSMAVDTLCSSSLTALHLAVQSVRSGECAAAIVGGVNLSIHPQKYLLHARGGMSSSDGRCRSFGKGGDGFVPGEGVGAILIKPLADALRDGDRVYALVKATVINQDGRTHGYTVPNPNAQADMIATAIRRAGVDPRRIGYVEAHGTGTALGDPIEIAGLTKAFAEFTSDRQFCAIGSVKSNIGHLESAAGVVGLTKILLQMRHGRLVPSLHAGELNPDIRFERTPFFVQRTLADWERPVVTEDGISRPVPRLACLSSFGAGGANAHAILEEFEAEPDSRTAEADGQPHAILLSAKDTERLSEVAERLARFIERNPSARLDDLAYTLQAGREHLETRAAFLANSRADLLEALRAIAEQREGEIPVYRGVLDRTRSRVLSLMEDEDLRAAVGRWLDRRRLDPALKAWIEGVTVDWARLHAGSGVRKIGLPPYPFAREHYWVPKRKAGARPTAGASAWLHPLLHRNTSDLWELRFSSTFDGSEFFLGDHRLGGERVLPAAACLELARAALEQATRQSRAAIRIENVVWIQPFAVPSRGRTLHVNLQPEGQGGVRFEIYTEDQPGARTTISQGAASLDAPAEPGGVDLGRLRERLPHTDLSAAQCYETFQAFGLEHGPSFRCLKEIRRGEEGVLARLALPENARAGLSAYALHPTLLDGLFQATLALGIAGKAGRPGIPFAMDRLVLHRPMAEEMWAWVRPSSEGAEKLDLDLCDDSGRVCLRIEGFSTRVVEMPQARPALCQRPTWKAANLATNGTGRPWARRYVALCGLEPSMGVHLATRLEQAVLVPLQPDAGDLASRFESTARQIFELVQRILTDIKGGEALLQLVLSATGEGALYRGLGGMLQTAHLENPAFHGQLIEVDAETGPDTILAIVTENAAHPEDTHVGYAGGARAVRTWEALEGMEPPKPFPWRTGGVYLIVGGAGGLGMLFAEEIVRRTEGCTVVLAGRSSLTPERESILRSLERPGVQARYRQVDVTDAAAVHGLVQDIVREHGSLNGILQAAGVLNDDYIVRKNPADLRRVLAPKVSGTVNLDEATRSLPLDFFILFASTIGVQGNAGQADYAAANGFLDAFAAYRDERVREGERQGRTLAVDWPLWKEGGMRPSAEMLEMLARETGETPLETAPGFEALAHAWSSGHPQVMVPPPKRESRPAAARASARPQPTTPSPTKSAPVANTGDLPERAMRFFRNLIATTVQCPMERVHVDEPFDSYGIDSLMVMQMTNELETSFGSLSKTLFFEHHDVRALAGYFLEHRRETLSQLLMGSTPAAPEPAVPSQPPAQPPRPEYRRFSQSVSLPARAAEALDIAIVGLAGRYPRANDLNAFWDNLSQGKDCIGQMPAERYQWLSFPSQGNGSPAVRLARPGGFLDDVDAFDPLFFNIAPRDARYLDPQERLFLETAWAALEDAGYRPRDLKRAGEESRPAQVGVYAGVMYSEYQLFAHEQTLAGQPTVAGNIYASIANRVSYCLDLRGPSMTLDTMCSSSLTGIHLACLDLRQGRTDLALAGGVNLTLHPSKYLLLSEGKFLSNAGRCASFGEGGDGYVPGEGVGVVVLKRLADAIRDGDAIHGVIKGTAIGHGGKTNGFTVPNPDAQQEVIARALNVAGIDPSRVTYVEAHSTGTPLGDPIELAGLTKAFQAGRQPHSGCSLGSVKSNIGHCEAAAGIAGLTKVLLQMRHGQLAPSLHSETLNRNLDLEATPFRVNRALTAWERQVVGGAPQPRVAGISGFGAGGSNAHLVVEEYVPPAASARPAKPCVFILSARGEQRLKEIAGRLRAFLTASPSLSLEEVAYTLQVGRQPLEERLAFTADSREELLKLLGHAERGTSAPAIHRGKTGDGSAETLRTLASDEDVELAATIDRWIAKGKLERLIELWVKGVDVDWRRLHPAPAPRRVHLPTYPFARDRYWLPREPIQAPAQASPREVPPRTPTEEWLGVREEWTAEAWPNATAVDALLRPRDGERIAIVCSDEGDGEAFRRAIERAAEEAGLRAGIRVDVIPCDRLESWRTDAPPAVVFILAPEPSLADLDSAHVEAVFRIGQKLMRGAWDAKIRLFHAHARSESQPRPRLEALTGMLRSAMLENGNHAWTCIALEDGLDAPTRHETLLREWLAADNLEGFAAFRHAGATRLRHRLVEHSAGDGGRPVFLPRRAYVVAGGLGPIGEQLCEELATRYQSTLVILSRGELDDRKREQCGQLETKGARVIYHAVDIADRPSLESVWRRVKSEVGAIHGILHLARTVEDGLLASKTWESFERVARAKVDGTLNLDSVSAGEPLDFFLLFSSLAAFGIRGSADYGYSAAFQNAFAAERARRVGRGERAGGTLALGWGSWNVDKYPSKERDQRLRREGFQLIEMASAFPWIERRGWRSGPFLGLARIHDRDRVRNLLGLEDGSQPPNPSADPLEHRLAEWERRTREGDRISPAEVAGVLRSDQASTLSGAQTDRLHALLLPSGNGDRPAPEVSTEPGENGSEGCLETIKKCLASLLELPEVTDAKSFHEYGMDSISGVRLAMLLGKKLKLQVPPQWLMEHPSPKALAAHLATVQAAEDSPNNGGAI